MQPLAWLDGHETLPLHFIFLLQTTGTSRVFSSYCNASFSWLLSRPKLVSSTQQNRDCQMVQHRSGNKGEQQTSLLLYIT